MSAPDGPGKDGDLYAADDALPPLSPGEFATDFPAISALDPWSLTSAEFATP